MKQRTYSAKTAEDLSAALAEIAASDNYRKASEVFVHILTNFLTREESADVLARVKKGLPRARTIGVSCDEKKKEKSIRLSVRFFQSSTVEVREYGPEENFAALGEKIAGELSAHPEIRGVELYYGGCVIELEKFLAAASAGHEDVPFFGVETQMVNLEPYSGRTGKNYFQELAAGFGPSLIIGDTVRDLGMTLAFYKGDDLHIKADAIFGWKPLGRELTVTKTEDDIVVARINDMPATKIYHKYLQVTPDEYFLLNICEFPLVFQRGDRFIPRAPKMYDEQHRLYFGGRVHKGDRFRLTYGNSTDIFYNTYMEGQRRDAPFRSGMRRADSLHEPHGFLEGKRALRD